MAEVVTVLDKLVEAQKRLGELEFKYNLAQIKYKMIIECNDIEEIKEIAKGNRNLKALQLMETVFKNNNVEWLWVKIVLWKLVIIV